MALNNFARLAQIYRATTVAGPELQAMTQVFMDPDGDTHTKTKLDGAGVSTSENENAISNKQAYNRSIVIGENIYWLQANKIYTWNTSTGTNTLVHTLPSGSNGNLRGMNTGLYQAIISGVPHIITLHAPNDTTLRSASYNIATSGWENRSTFSLSAFTAVEASGGFRAEILYDNKLYIAGNRHYIIYNPHNDQYTEGRFPNVAYGPFDWCPYQGKLYLTAKNITNGSIQIYEMVNNSGPTLAAETYQYGIAGEESLEGRSCLFTDRDHLYAIAHSSGTPNTGYGIYKFGNVSGIMTFIGDVTSTINMGTSTKNTSDGNSSHRWRCTAFVNQSNAPDGKEGITFYFDRGGGTGNHLTLGVPQYYEQELWDTPSTNFQYDDATQPASSGGRVDTSLIHTAFQLAYTNTKNGAGDRVYNISIAPEPRVQVLNVSTSETGVGITYRIATNSINFPNGTPCAVIFKYDAYMHSPRTNCYLEYTSHGSLVGNRKIVVTADSGVAYYTVWAPQQDGFTGRVRAALVPFISTTGTA